MEIAKIGSR